MADKRTCVVTGGNRGLGLATARALAEAGHRVIIGCRDQSAGQQVVAEFGGEALALDVSSDQSVAAFAAQVPAADIVINNAGAMFADAGASTMDYQAAQVLDAVNTNALGAFRMCKAYLPGMNERGFGRIVNVSTGMAGLAEMDGGWAAYRMSKTALNAVTRLFAAEAKGSDVKVNSVCPGWVQTDMGGPGATRTIPEGAASILWAANLGADGPSGGFFRDGEPTPW